MSAESGKGQRPIDVDGVICNLAAIVRVHEGNRCPLMNKLIESDVPKAREAVAALVEALKEFVPGSSSMTLTEVERIDRAIAALRAAGVATFGGLEESL